MKIISEQKEIPKTENLTTEYIEEELAKLKIKPLRWAIVEVSKEKYILNVSYKKN